MSNTLSMQQPQVSVALSLPSLPLLSRFLTPSLIFWPPGNCLSLVSELLHLSIFLYLWFLHLYARMSGSTTPFAEYPFFLDFVSESAPSFVYLDVSIPSSPTDSFQRQTTYEAAWILAWKHSVLVFIFFCCCRWSLMTAYNMCVR